MLSGRVTQTILRLLDRITPSAESANNTPAHQRTGRRGEEDAYFYLRRCGYVALSGNSAPP
jgi:hypothetical protein